MFGLFTCDDVVFCVNEITLSAAYFEDIHPRCDLLDL